ncbi:MAG: AraC family transcriptional regulator [Lachnospiraceae bacterium]|nr:AraC family transcriptional regulator [Lachnospiraceae bacterium]
MSPSSPIMNYQYRRSGRDPLKNTEHSHTTAEILLVNHGSGSLIIADRIFPLNERCIYFIPENTLHYSAPDDQKEYNRSVVNLSPDFLSDLTEITGFSDILSFLYQRRCFILDYDACERIEAEFGLLQSPIRRDYACALLKIFDLCANHGFPPNQSNDKLSAIMMYINQNIGEKLTLDEISSALFINKFYLCHMFKKHTGMSLSQYILMQRLSLAKGRLISSGQSISQISSECGFSSFSYFSRIFKETEGLSAREYRRKYSKLQ